MSTIGLRSQSYFARRKCGNVVPCRGPVKSLHKFPFTSIEIKNFNPLFSLVQFCNSSALLHTFLTTRSTLIRLIIAETHRCSDKE